MDIEVKFLQNLASGEVHVVTFCSVRGERRRSSQEECNIDDIDHKAWLTEEEARAAPNHCGNCWATE